MADRFQVQNLLAIMMEPMEGVCPRAETAIRLIIAATQVGANIEYLKQKTGYDIDKIRPLADRLREANIWHGKSVDAREWLPCSRLPMQDVHIARSGASGAWPPAEAGPGKRRRFISTTWGEEMARFPITERSKWCRRFRVPLDPALYHPPESEISASRMAE